MKSKNNNLKVIPKKNYKKITAIFIITILIVVILFIFYNSQKRLVSDIPVIRGTLSEVEEEDFNNYITEHDDFLLYVGVAFDDNCREIEEDLKEVLKNRGLLDTLYLNITTIDDKTAFYERFNDKYSNNVRLEGYPAFIIISDKKIVDLVQKKENKLFISDIERLLDEYSIGTKND